MLKKIANFLFSTRFTAFLFIAFALAMAIGTFLDMGMDTSPTPYSRTLIYNTWWFELIMLLFVVNFCGNIFRYKLYKKEKWATLLLHLSFILILIGAGITRYISYEGMMAIREGALENKFLSRETYVEGFIDGNYKVNGVLQRKPFEKVVDFSERLNNTFTLTESYNNQDVTINLEQFIKGAEEDIIPDENGESYLKIVEAGNGKPHNHFIKVGTTQLLHNVLIALNNPTNGAINITYNKDDNSLSIQSPFEGEYMQMATQTKGKLIKDSIQPLMLRSAYSIGNMQMVFPKSVVKGVFEIVKKPQILKTDEDGIILNVTANGETKQVGLLGGEGVNAPYKKVTIGNLDIRLKYGSKVRELPFSIKLNDFIAEKYPGTERSYKSFISNVTVLDQEKGDFDYSIYMNHILDHRGYRFFQSSFDTDEKGTILSVNHDFWGTWLTYIGYFLLFFGLIMVLLVKNTRMSYLRKQLKKIKKQKATLLVLLMVSFAGFAQQDHNHIEESKYITNEQLEREIDSILKINITPLEHAKKFGKLVIQDTDGRMKPVQTYASELLRKISRKDNYLGYNPTQIYLSMHESPMLWYRAPLVYLAPKKADSVKTILGISKEQNYATLLDFFTPDARYKLAPYLENAYKTQVKNLHQKEIIKADQHSNLLASVIEGRSIKLFPIPDDEGNKWISSFEYRNNGYKNTLKDSLYGNFINSGFSAYLFTLNDAKQTKDFSKAERLLKSFKDTQHKYGSNVMLSDQKIDAEIAYNDLGIFKNSFIYYFLASILLIIFGIIEILVNKNKIIKYSINFLLVIITLLFFIHLGGLILRWYISGHAPWSDTYETMLYIAWSCLLFGLILGRNNTIVIGGASFVTAIILLFAHQYWLDPSISNLEAVLNSYWVLIHVSIIVVSYGPFALGMILGFLSLILMLFSTHKNAKRIKLNIKEITIINEIALTIGLVLLTIGNFLGGMWANESWGRYWGWDPKETWALISIMVYAFVIHMRLIPGLRSRWLFCVASIFAFYSVMMTYVGVNFYLAGLHSYASGDQVMSIYFVFSITVFFILIASVSYIKYNKYLK